MKTFSLSAVLVATSTLAQSPSAQDLNAEHDAVLTLGQSETLSTGIDRVTAMDSDDTFVFAATSTKLVKMNAAEITDYSTEDVGTSHGVTDISSLRVDADHVYMTASIGQGQLWKMYKLNKADWSVSCVYTYEPHENIPYAMQYDDTYIYTGQYTSPGKIVRIAKETCAKTGETLELSDGENDIRAMEFDSRDAQYLYANTNTAPGRVVKVDLQSWTRHSAATLNQGEDHLLSGAEQDDDHIYVGTNTEPAHVVKVAKANMQRVMAVTLKDGEKEIISMDSDASHIYAPTYSTPPSVVRIRKENMEREDAIELPDSLTAGIAAITHVGSTLFAGIDSAPASINAIEGYLAPGDCVMGAWTPWSTCNRGGASCGTGVQERERTVTTEATNGGKQCSTELKSYKQCGHADICPQECPSGSKKKWVERTQSAVPTCDIRSPTSQETSTPGCECPADKPFWHAETCVSATECDKNLVPCTQTTCIFQAGKVQVHHPQSTGNTVDFPENGYGGFQCHHHPGRTGDCTCLCHTKSDSPSDETYPH